MKTEYSFGQNPHMSILSEITGEFGWSALNFLLKTICNQSEYLPCLQLRLLIWCGKSPLRVENPQWRSRFLFFRHCPLSLFTLLQSLRFNSFRKISKRLRQKVGPTVLCYLFGKLLFGKYPSSFAVEKVGPICQPSLLIVLLRKSHLGLRNPLRRSLFFFFRTSTFLIIPLSSNWFRWCDRDNIWKIS